MKKSSVFDCTLVEHPQIQSSIGRITAININKEIPFEVKRIFYLYDIPGGEAREVMRTKNLSS